MTHVKLKEIIKLQDIIKKDCLNNKSNRRGIYNFGKYSLLKVILRDIHEGYLSLENTDHKQSNFVIE